MYYIGCVCVNLDFDIPKWTENNLCLNMHKLRYISLIISCCNFNAAKYHKYVLIWINISRTCNYTLHLLNTIMTKINRLSLVHLLLVLIVIDTYEWNIKMLKNRWFLLIVLNYNLSIICWRKAALCTEIWFKTREPTKKQ